MTKAKIKAAVGMTGQTFSYYLHDIGGSQGYMPRLYASFSEADITEYRDAMARYQYWQELLAAVYRDTQKAAQEERDVEKELAELARLKAKYEAKL